MCTASAGVVYGLTVRSASLVFAADAWTRLKDTFPFLDLVLLRRRSGTLTTGIEQGGIARLPDEIWEEIRFWLVRREVADAEHNLLSPFACTPSSPTSKRSPKRVEWSTRDQSACCEYHLNRLKCWTVASVNFWNGGRALAMDNLLSRFGLDRPSKYPIQVDESWPHPGSLAIVSVPSRFLGGDISSGTITAACGAGHHPDEHTIVDVSSKLARDVDQRFQRLVRLFGLDVVESSINELSSHTAGRATGSTRMKPGDPQSSGIRNDASKDIRPRWLLWTTCEQDP
ncbi:hypothetical protein JCM16303_002852 [Sporobolomyces ruberrimus]